MSADSHERIAAEFRIRAKRLHVTPGLLAARLDVERREPERWMNNNRRRVPAFAWEFLGRLEQHLEDEAVEAVEAAVRSGKSHVRISSYRTDERAFLEAGISADTHGYMIGAMMDLLDEQGITYQIQFFEDQDNG